MARQAWGMDLFAAGHIDKYRLFKNNNCPGSFLNITLIGVESNPNGIGAQADVWVSGQRISRNVLPDGGFHDNSDLKLHFGLDGAYSTDSIIVYWPSGVVQKLYGINANQFLTIVEDESTMVTKPKITDRSSMLYVYPNPVRNDGTIRLQLIRETKVELSIIDINGNHIRTIMNGPLDAGLHEFDLDISDLSSGIYILKVQSRSFMQWEKLLIQK